MNKFITSFLLLGCLPSFACMHYDKNFKYKIKEGTKAAFLFHDGKNAHLVVKTDLKVDGRGQLPSSLSWVMPFPSLPSKYEVVDAEVFTEIERILQGPVDYLGPETRGSLGGKGKSSIKVHPKKYVDAYIIEPIEIISESDGQEFNEWLAKKDLNPMPMENQKYYLKKGAVFLAITAKVSGKTANLKPLHIVYSSEKLSFPLKFTHDTRTFNLDLYVLAAHLAKPEEYEPFYLDLGPGQPVVLGGRGTNKLDVLVGKRQGNLFKLSGKGINEKDKPLSKLASDPTFSP